MIDKQWLDHFFTDAELHRAAGMNAVTDAPAPGGLRRVAQLAIERYIGVEQLPKTEQQLERALEALKALNHPRT